MPMLAVFTVLAFLFPSMAQAYVDPGTGSLIFQGIAASILGIGVFWRRIVARIQSLFGGKSKIPPESSSNSQR